MLKGIRNTSDKKHFEANETQSLGTFYHCEVRIRYFRRYATVQFHRLIFIFVPLKHLKQEGDAAPLLVLF